MGQCKEVSKGNSRINEQKRQESDKVLGLKGDEENDIDTMHDNDVIKNTGACLVKKSVKVEINRT